MHVLFVRDPGGDSLWCGEPGAKRDYQVVRQGPAPQHTNRGGPGMAAGVRQEST